MKLHNLGYLFKEGARNIVHNKLMSMSCIGVLVACLLLIGGATMLSLNLNTIVDFVESQNEVRVFLDEDLSSSDIEVIGLSLSNFQNIAGHTFISKEQAMEEQMQLLGEDAVLLMGLEENNPFPDTYVVQIDDLAYLEPTLERLREMEGVEKVNASTEVAAILVGARRIISMAGLSVVAILVLVSLFLITSTIKLTVYSRRREINIMKYVGATDTFIRMPFIVEGVLIGLIAAILAFLALGFGYTYILQWVNESFGGYLGLGTIFDRAVDFWTISHYIFGAFAALGVFVGVVGSGTFINRYLKV